MNLDEALKTAKESVQGAGLPTDWELTAFKTSLQFLLGGLGASAASSEAAAQDMSDGGGYPPLGANSSGAAAADAPGGVQQFSARVKVPVPALEDIFAFDGDSIRLHVSSAKISTSKSKAAREVAILVAAARQGTGLDDGWTSSGHIRQALSDYGRLDSSNFAASLKSVSDAFNFRGKGTNVEVRLTQPGWEIATQMVRSVAGVSE